MLKLSDPVDQIPLIGPAQAKKLEKLEIRTVKDLLYHFPRRYEDFSQIKPINQVRAGEKVTITGTVSQVSQKHTKTGKHFVSVLIKDQSGFIQAVWWNQPWVTRSLKINKEYHFSGKTNPFNQQLTLINPQFEPAGEPPKQTIHTGALIPIYPETEGISSKWLRSRIAAVLNRINGVSPSTKLLTDPLPDKLREKFQLLSLPQALYWIHFPKNRRQMKLARYRLAFDELFYLQLKTLARRKNWEKRKSIFQLDLRQTKNKINSLISTLPFELTSAQKRLSQEILEDLQKKAPMNRLLQGDVGSGKTVVAAIAAYATCLSGFRAVFMAPTEILAEQHHQTLSEIFSQAPIKIQIFTRTHKPGKLKSDLGDIIVGTHALLYDQSQLSKVGLVIIDEQHRFGVKQRAKLVKKAMEENFLNRNPSRQGTAPIALPHILSLTATPIPRSVALTLYGDQDLSILDEMPPGRKPVKTWVVPSFKRQAALAWIKEQILTHNHQAFIICPLIKESEAETLQSVKAATVEFQKLQKETFPELKLGLIHGRQKSAQKTDVLNKFRQRKIDILVSTPVVEVGLDIPGANIMVIEAAERFGLASLHQLRGRIGRRGQQAYCLLFTSKKSLEHKRRLKALERYESGLKLAEIDLKIRGPGELFGTKQHGFWDLKLASLENLELIEKTRKAVIEYRQIKCKAQNHNPK